MKNVKIFMGGVQKCTNQPYKEQERRMLSSRMIVSSSCSDKDNQGDFNEM